MNWRASEGFRVRSFVAVLAVVVVSLVLVGCGGIAGVYEMSEKDTDGTTVTMSLELKGDNTAVFMLKGSNADDVLSQTGTYSVSGDKVTVTMDGDAQVFTLSGNKLSARLMGDDVVLVKK